MDPYAVITDGTYILVSSTFYGTCQGPEQDRSTWQICGNDWETIQESTLSGATTHQDMSTMATPAGAGVMLRVTCGNQQSVVFGYDASPTMLRLYTGGTTPTMGRVDTFMKQ